MIIARTWAGVPNRPAVYAMYGGEPPRTWVAYVGIGENLNSRLTQHFVRRDSSVVTGSSAVGLNIDGVRFVRWWEHEAFADDDHRHAAELVAFDVLQPALVSRGNSRKSARTLAADPSFRVPMEALFSGDATGQYIPPRLDDLAARVLLLEDRVAALESLLLDPPKRDA